jgi:hypothetical protein
MSNLEKNYTNKTRHPQKIFSCWKDQKSGVCDTRSSETPGWTLPCTIRVNMEKSPFNLVGTQRSTAFVIE